MDLPKKRVLLHSCCGPCSTASIERILPEYDVTVFYYNPNITDSDEYEKRKQNQILFINEFNKRNGSFYKIRFSEGEYKPEDFYEVASGLENEPEGGRRCAECFRLRLEKTAQAAQRSGYPVFGTTLTVSPHKSYPLIASIGKELAKKYGVEFLDIDFKKKEGFKRSVELSEEYGLYRQDYCGCEYSDWHNERL